MPWALFAISIISGAVAIVSFKGTRRGNEPCCRACDQIVGGITGDRCPECGADLTKPKAIVRGGRIRKPALVWVSLFACLLSTTPLCVKIYQGLTEPGWEKNAPVWWLSNIEMRFATGIRFDQACTGLLCAQGKRRASPEQVQNAGMIAFDRLRSQPESMMRMHSRDCFGVAGLASLNYNCDMKELCRVTRICTVLSPTVGGGGVSPTTNKPTFGFIPEGWEIRYSYTVEDSQGALTGIRGDGSHRVRNAGRGVSSGLKGGGRNPTESGVFYVQWEFQLGKPGEPSLATWHDAQTWTFDKEAEEKRVREAIRTRQEEIASRTEDAKRDGKPARKPNWLPEH